MYSGLMTGVDRAQVAEQLDAQGIRVAAALGACLEARQQQGGGEQRDDRAHPWVLRLFSLPARSAEAQGEGKGAGRDTGTGKRMRDPARFRRGPIRASVAPVNILSIQSWVAYGHVGNA